MQSLELGNKLSISVAIQLSNSIGIAWFSRSEGHFVTPELEGPWTRVIQIMWLVEKPETVQVHFNNTSWRREGRTMYIWWGAKSTWHPTWQQVDNVFMAYWNIELGSSKSGGFNAKLHYIVSAIVVGHIDHANSHNENWWIWCVGRKSSYEFTRRSWI